MKSILISFWFLIGLTAILADEAEDNFNFNLNNLFNVQLSSGEPSSEPEATTAKPFDPCENYNFLEQRASGSILICPPKTPNYNVCGIRLVNGLTSRLTSQSDTSKEFEFPWMISISLFAPNIVPVFQASGSLIHPSIVMTIAHKVDGKRPNQLVVKGGAWDLLNKDPLYPPQNRYVRDIIVHENYNQYTLVYDIALLFLKNPFDITAHIRTICLPPPHSNYDGEQCTVTGWGKNDPDGNFQAQLQKLDMPIVPNKECQTRLRATMPGSQYTLHDSHLCAGGKIGEDACHGDGGSPLVCKIAGSSSAYHQVGIVAAGRGCGTAVPGVYASIPFVRYWIDRQVIAAGFNTTFYTNSEQII